MVANGIALEDVTYRRGEVTVLERQRFELPRGSTLVITGANGVGKSTALHLCAGLLAPDAGTVALGGHRVDPARPASLIRFGVRRGFVFQQGGLVANLSALHNVALPLRYHADALGLDEAVLEGRARSCLAAVGIEGPMIHALPGRLSFGIAKRVAFARAMAIEPNFAFFDDPDTGLDDENARVVRDILVSYRDDPAVTMVIATNQRELIDRLGVPPHELRGGRLCAVEPSSVRAVG